MKKIIIYVFFAFLGSFILSGCKINKPIDISKVKSSEITYHYKKYEENEKTKEYKLVDKEYKISYKKDEIVNKPDETFLGNIKSHRLIYWEFNGEKYEFGRTLSQNIDLYAKYEIKKVELKTIVDGVERFKSVDYNTLLSKVGLTDPIKKHHEFIGWYKKSGEIEEELKGDFKIDENIELVAKFKPIDIAVNISFSKNSKGEDVWEIIKVPYGSTLTKENLTYHGLYYDIGINNPQDESKKLTGFLDNGFPFDVFKEKILEEGHFIKPNWGERFLEYTLNLPDKKIHKFAKYEDNILHNPDDFPLYENKYFKGVYTKDGNLITSNYKLLKDRLEFDVKYYDNLPNEAFKLKLNSDGISYSIDGIKRDYIGEFTIPDEVDGKKITKLSDGAFSSFTKIKVVNFNKYITEIPNRLFYNCTSLEKINVDYSKITYVGNEAFGGCAKLEEFKFEDSIIEKIGYSAFDGCASLKKVIFPDTLKKIGNSAFKDCENINNLNLNQIEEIGDSVFENCFGIKKVNIPLTLKIISESAFRNNKNLEKVSFHNELTKILSYAFKDCPKLENYTIPESLDELGHEMFDKNDNVKVLNLPYVRRLDSRSFVNFKNLEEIKMNELISLREDIFYKAPKFRTITVKNYRLQGEHTYLSNYGVTLNVLENLDVSPENHTWENFIMKKDALINLENKKLKLNSFETKKIVMSDDVRSTNVKFYDDSLEYIYIGKNFDDRDQASEIFESAHPYKNQIVEVSSENKIIKEYKGFYYINKNENSDYLENPKYWLVGVKDTTPTTLDLIDGYYQSEFVIENNGRFKDGIPKIEKLIVNQISNSKISWYKFIRYANLKEVKFNKNSADIYSVKYGCVYNKDETICYFSPVALEMDEFIIPKNQPATENLFLHNKNIKEFKIENDQDGPYWFINKTKKYLYRKISGRINLERYFSTDEEFILDNSDPIGNIASYAFSGNYLKLKKLVLDRDTLNGHNEFYLYGTTEIEFRRNLNSSAYFKKAEQYQNDIMTLIISGTTTKITQRFENCKIAEIIGFEKVEEVGEMSFFEQKLLDNLDFSSIKKIGNLAFVQTAIRELKNLSKDAEILYGAFKECKNLKEIYFGEKYDVSAFNDCENVEKIIIDKEDAEFGGRLILKKINHVEITEKVKSLYWNYQLPPDDIDENKQKNNLQTELVLSKNLRHVSGLDLLFPNLKKLTIQAANFSNDYSDTMNGFKNLEELILGKDVSIDDDELINLNILEKLKKITIHPDNHNFNVINDCLLDSEGNHLIRYIGSNDEIDVPDSVQYIHNYFANAVPNLKKLVIGKKIQKILNMPKSVIEVTIKSNELELDNLFDRGIENINIGNEIKEDRIIEIANKFKKVKSIKLLDGSNFANQFDEVFYSKDNKKLIAYPAYLKKKEFRIPRHVEEITATFNENNYLERLYIPKELDKFSGNVNHCYRLTIIVEKGAKFQNKSNINIFNPSYQVIIWNAIFDY